MENQSTDLYLDLIKRILINYIYSDDEVWPVIKPRGFISSSIVALFDKLGFGVFTQKKFNEEIRIEGMNWPPPPFAHSMIGLKRLDNIQFCIEEVITKNIGGDLIEAGVWRGGSTIFMRAVLKAYRITDRLVWVADSFEGLPEPDLKKYPQDKGLKFHEARELSVSLEKVKTNFRKYDLLDNQVKFIKGWFSETLSSAPINELSVIRIDCDMYGSTMDSLKSLYPKLNPGGFIIIDDYGAIEACRKAVEDYRNQNSISDGLNWIDYSGVYWKKGG